MKNRVILNTVLLSCTAILSSCMSSAKQTWTIDSQADWEQLQQSQTNLNFENGFAEPLAKNSSYTSKIKNYKQKVKAKTITFEQSPVWDNWEASKRIAPTNLGDAPVFLQIGPQNYWMFGRYRCANAKKNFKAKTVKIDGYTTELKTTPFKNQYDAPGGLKPSKGGYHAWQSRDMKTWIHHGPVTEGFSKWVTTAEYVDGKTYIYYDYPNDMDPHLYIDNDLTDGKPGKNMGLAFADPTYGSDCAFIRDEKGNVHVIYED